MRFVFRTLVLAGLSFGAFAARAQQTTPTPTLSDDSVRVMSGLVQTSVRQLRAIYFEPNDARAAELIDKALVEIPVLNQRLSHYTASLPREQQQQLAQRLRRQPWQVELNTLLRSPQFKGFDARAAKNPDLKLAAERLRASGFLGTSRAATAATSPAAPGVAAAPAATAAPAKPQPAVAAVAAAPKAQAPAPTPKAAANLAHHTVQKGETLFSISRQYGVTPTQLQEWNDKPDNGVKVGEVLVVEAAK